MERERGMTNGDAIQVMVLNRLTSPSPLCSVEDSARVCILEEAFGIAPTKVNYDRLARALASAVSTRIEDEEADVSLRIMSRYRISPEVFHFDASSLYFEDAYEDSDLVRLGYSRDQKPDNKQVNIALDVDANEGMPLFHTIHNRNTPDPRMTVANPKTRERLKPDRMLVVGDRSAMDGEVALMLRDYRLDFLGAVKMTEKAKELVASIPDEESKPLNVEDYSAAESAVQFSHDGRMMDSRGGRCPKPEEGRTGFEEAERSHLGDGVIIQEVPGEAEHEEVKGDGLGSEEGRMYPEEEEQMRSPLQD
jgi:hypothetical protein